MGNPTTTLCIETGVTGGVITLGMLRDAIRLFEARGATGEEPIIFSCPALNHDRILTVEAQVCDEGLMLRLACPESDPWGEKGEAVAPKLAGPVEPANDDPLGNSVPLDDRVFRYEPDSNLSVTTDHRYTGLCKELRAEVANLVLRGIYRKGAQHGQWKRIR